MTVTSVQEAERWHDAPVGHVVAGPCPRCLRDGKCLNGCRHQLPNALGYVIASFILVDGTLVPMGDAS